MFKNIILSGCSFVHGDDICSEAFQDPTYTFFTESYKTWTKLQKEYFEKVRLSGQLLKFFDCKIFNLGKPGASNSTILNILLNFLHDNKFNKEETLVLLGWTDRDRQDFYFNTVGTVTMNVYMADNYARITEHRKSLTKNEWYTFYAEETKKLMPYFNWIKDNTAMNHYFYRQHLEQIKLAELTIENYGYKYIFWNSMQHFPLDPSLDIKQNTIQNIKWDHWFPNFNETSYEYSWVTEVRKQGFHTKTYHPNEKAVSLFAEKLSKAIKKKYQ